MLQGGGDSGMGNVTITPLDSSCDLRHGVINGEWKRYLEGAGDHQTGEPAQD
jgi:hypothetical protein